jgi:hypothetical protein
LSFDTPKLTARDYLIGGSVLFAAFCVLFAIVYAVARLVFFWLPVGCTP